MAQSEPSWLSTSQTESYLNIKRRMLYKQKDADFLKMGVHYRVLNPMAERPTYQWNAQAIEAQMEGAIDFALAA
jgi:hypothetical protein